MAMFDDEDDEQAKPDMNPAVKDYLMKKRQPTVDPVGPAVEDANLDVRYKRAAEDTSAIEDASMAAKRRNMVLGVIQGLSQMFAPKHTNNAAFDGFRAANDAKVADAKAAHRKKLDDLLTTDKIQRQSVERAQDDKKFGWDEANKDPSKLTPGARLVMAKRLGVGAQHLEGLSFDQAKQLQSLADKGAREGGQLKAVETERGVEWYVFDPNNQTMKPTGLLTGYKLSIDNTTGTRTSGADKNAPATDIMTADGGTARDLRTETDVARAYGKGTATQQVKDEQKVQEADSKVVKTDELAKRWEDLYDRASQEGPVGNTGPIAGRAAETAAGLGFDVGPATNEAANEMHREAQAYIVEMTGLSSTDQQFQTLLKAAPRLGTSKEQFKSRLKTWQNDVKRAAEQRRREAAPVGEAPTTPKAPASPRVLSARDQEMLDKAKAAVVDPNTPPEVKASAQKVIDRLSK